MRVCCFSGHGDHPRGAPTLPLVPCWRRSKLFRVRKSCAMIVYGDSHFDSELGEAAARVRERAQKTLPDSVEQLRTLLIQAGQLEQGIADQADCTVNQCDIAQRVTDIAANAFYAAYADATPFNPTGKSPDALAELSRILLPLVN